METVFSHGYQMLRLWLAPLVPFIFPRHFPQWLSPVWLRRLAPARMVENERLIFITANVITIFRTLLVIPIGILLHMGYVHAGFTVYVIGGLLDFVDGLVAMVHRKLGYNDNLDTGAFLDAFCDKFYYAGNMSVTLLLANYQHLPKGATIIIVALCLTILGLEVRLGITRVVDFFYNLKNNVSQPRDLKAKSSGKLKYALELVGLGGLILSLPDLSGWTIDVSLACFFLAVPFALKSLKQKLSARQPV